MHEKISAERKIKCGILNGLMYASAGLICLILLGLIGYILYRGLGNISWELLSTKPSLIRGTTGILPNILNTLYIILITLVNDVKKLVKGLMIESYIEDGAQKPEECTYGKSITDPCLGWVKTEKLIYDLAELL